MRGVGIGCLLFVVFLSLCMVYMRLEYKQVQVKRLDLKGAGDALEDLRIVYATDFQYDLKSRGKDRMEEETFQRAVDLINGQDADIVLLGGDYITFAQNVAGAAAYLEQIQAPLGVFGVFGNHDARAKGDLIKRLPNICFLQNEAAHIPYGDNTIAIFGVEDLKTGKPSIDLTAVENASYRILLSHNPDYYESMSGEERAAFDLVLAGHTHGGQVTFFGLAGIPSILGRATDYGERYRYGEKNLYEGRIYISAGLGGEILHQPFRFGVKPEIVVIE